MLLSIISPVYNVAPYICECIDTVIAQTMTDWELIFVDDHGTDNSIEIAHKYIAKFDIDTQKRFRFIETPCNSGPGIARNIGIAHARGEYISFIDSDDLLDPQMYDKLLIKAYGGINLMQICTPETDLVCCNIKKIKQNGDYSVLINPDISKGKKYYLKHFVTFITTYIYRRNFLIDNNLSFPSERASEDTNFLTKTLLLARSIRQVNEPLYIYRIRPQSISTSKNKTRYKQRLSSIAKLKADIKQLKKDPKNSDLHIEQYDTILKLIYFKKGTLMALLDYLKYYIK